MDAEQTTLANPFGMDEHCTNCPALCETRDRVVHGYGDATADFVFVGERPRGRGANRTGVPFTGDDAGHKLQEILGALGLNNASPDADEPDLENVYLTHLTRCHHPKREPTDEEVAECEAFLTAEIRMINPEVIVPVGERALAALAAEYTTTSPDALDVGRDHATSIRGRGFELVPMVAPENQTEAQTEAFVEFFGGLLERDYRQTKGRRSR